MDWSQKVCKFNKSLLCEMLNNIFMWLFFIASLYTRRYFMNYLKAMVYFVTMKFEWIFQIFIATMKFTGKISVKIHSLFIKLYIWELFPSSLMDSISFLCGISLEHKKRIYGVKAECVYLFSFLWSPFRMSRWPSRWGWEIFRG